jgi:superfamily II DNA/RNA helicase
VHRKPVRGARASFTCLKFITRCFSPQELGECLRDAGYAAGALHGDREQTEREEALRAFKAGHTPLLVNTRSPPPPDSIRERKH